MEKQYKIELHAHTAEVSLCAQASAAEMIEIYHKNGYDAVCITDHMTPFYAARQDSWKAYIDRHLTGYRKARECGQRLGIKVYLGIEANFAENRNDYLTYGFDEAFLYQNEGLTDLGVERFSQLMHKAGCFISQAHPFRLHMTVTDPALLDGVEVYNGNYRHNSHNAIALRWAQENGLAMTSGSDFHQLDDFACGGIMTDRLPEDEAALAKMLFSGEGILGILRREEGMLPVNQTQK